MLYQNYDELCSSPSPICGGCYQEMRSCYQEMGSIYPSGLIVISFLLETQNIVTFFLIRE